MNSLAIYKASQHPQEAREFLKWATQPRSEMNFATFSDIAADKQACSQLPTYIRPIDFAKTLIYALPAFEYSVTTTKDQLISTLNDLIQDLLTGKTKPEETAIRMEQQGNVVLANA